MRPRTPAAWLRSLRELPVFVHRRMGLWVVLPFALLTVGASWMLPRVRVNPGTQLSLSLVDEYSQTRREIETLFAPTDYVLIALPTEEPFSPAALMVAERVSARVAELPGVQKVLSIVTATELVVEGETIEFRSLYRSSQDPTLKGRVASNPQLGRFLLAADGRALTVWVFPEREAETRPLIRDVDRIVREETQATPILVGERTFRYATERAIERDLSVLGPLCMAAVLAALCLFSRSVRVGGVLWLGSVLPAVWTLGLCGLLGVEISVWNLMVPFQVLALSTSYGIHLHRQIHDSEGTDTAPALRAVTPVIGWAGFMTNLGFASLLLSPLPEFRMMGALLVAGIAFSIGCSLLLLPTLLTRLPRTTPRQVRMRVTTGSTRVPGVLRWVFLGGVVFMTAGIPLLGIDFRYNLYLGPNTDQSRSVAFVQQHYGGVYELSLVVDTGRQYGLTDTVGFDRLRDLVGRLAGVPGVHDVLSVVPFVDGVSAAGGASIGESLELLAGVNPGIRIDSLVDIDYRRARVVVQFDPGRGRPRQVQQGLEEITRRIADEAARSFPDTRSRLSGYPLEIRRLVDYVQSGQLRGTVAYLIVMFLLVTALLRSARWGAVALLPAFVGLGTYFGLMGWFGLPLTAIASMVSAEVMGVGVDDVLCLIVTYREFGRASRVDSAVTLAMDKARRAIVETSTAMVAGLLVLVFSVSPLLAQSGVQIAVALSLSSATTVLIVPVVIRRLFLRRRR